MRRASVSIPANIAEGCGKQSEKDFARCLSIAAGSTSGTEYLLTLSADLKYSEESFSKELLTGINEIKKMLNSIIIKIAKDKSKMLIAKC